MTDFIYVHVATVDGRRVGTKYVNSKYVICLELSGSSFTATVHIPESGTYTYEVVMPFRRFSVDDVALHLMRRGPE